MTIRKAKSIIEHYPLNDSVIIKRVTTHSAFAINNSRTDEQLFDKSKDISFKYFEVVAYGELTNTIEIGDKVYIDPSTLISEVNVNDPEYSLDKYRSIIALNPDYIKSSQSCEIHKYFRISFHAIYSIVGSDRFKDSIKLE